MSIKTLFHLRLIMYNMFPYIDTHFEIRTLLDFAILFTALPEIPLNNSHKHLIECNQMQFKYVGKQPRNNI